MPLYEFTCNLCEHEHTQLVKMGTQAHDCPECGGNSRKVIRTAPNIDWGAMGAQKNVSPEFIDRFEKVHKEEAARERKLEESNGPP